MKASVGYIGHSAQIEMELLVNGATLSIGQMGPDFLLLDDPIDVPPGNAVIVFSVDGNARRWEVRLPEGVAAGRQRVPIANA
jgi:hypothetical protein